MNEEIIDVTKFELLVHGGYYDPGSHRVYFGGIGRWVDVPTGYEPIPNGEAVLTTDLYLLLKHAIWETCCPSHWPIAKMYASVVVRLAPAPVKNEVVIE